MDISYTLDSNLLRTAASSPVGEGATYWFTQIGQRNVLVKAIGPGCATCSFPSTGWNYSMYNDDGTLFSRSTANDSGVYNYYSYDAKANITLKAQYASDWQHNALGVQQWQWNYNSFGEPLTATDPLGHVTTYNYDTYGNLLSVRSPSPNAGETPGSLTQFVYDPGGTGLVTEII